MKKNHGLWLFPRKWLKKILFIMRLTGFFCLMCVFACVGKISAKNVRFDLKMEDVTIEQVLNQISESTKLDFFYNNSRSLILNYFDHRSTNAAAESFNGISSKNTEFRIDPFSLTFGYEKRKSFMTSFGVGPEGFEPPTLWV